MRLRMIVVPLVMLVVVTTASAGTICSGYRRFTMVGNSFVNKTFICEECYGDVVNNSGAPDFCPSSGSDNCNGTCSNNSSRECLADSDCVSPGICVQTADGIKTRCYGSASDNLSLTGPVIIDLGGGDDVLTVTNSSNIVQAGTGNDKITLTSVGSGSNWLNGGPFATSGADISGDDIFQADHGTINDTWIGGGGRDIMRNKSGSANFMGTTGLTAYGAYPKVADDTVGALICGGTASTILGAGPRHVCMEAQFITGFGTTCYYQYDNAVLGTRTPDASDTGTTAGCGTSTQLGSGGTLDTLPPGRCGCN
jgi:hypothetical protein